MLGVPPRLFSKPNLEPIKGREGEETRGEEMTKPLYVTEAELVAKVADEMYGPGTGRVMPSRERLLAKSNKKPRTIPISREDEIKAIEAAVKTGKVKKLPKIVIQPRYELREGSFVQTLDKKRQPYKVQS